MKLDQEQDSMLRGDPGSVRSRALRTLVEYEKAFNAKRLVPIQSCHLAGSFGIMRFKAYYSILEHMVDEGLRVSVPTTVNPRPGARLNLINRFVIKKQDRVEQSLAAVGVTPNRGIPIVEYGGPDLFDCVRDGSGVEIDGSTGEIRVRTAT